MDSSVKINFKKTVEKQYEHPGLKVFRAIYLTIFLVAKISRYIKYFIMHLKLRLTCLKNNLLLLGDTRGHRDHCRNIYCNTPMLSVKPPPLFTHSLWFDWSFLLSEGHPEDLKSLISHPDLTNNFNLYIQLPLTFPLKWPKNIQHCLPPATFFPQSSPSQ